MRYTLKGLKIDVSREPAAQVRGFTKRGRAVRRQVVPGLVRLGLGLEKKASGIVSLEQKAMWSELAAA